MVIDKHQSYPILLNPSQESTNMMKKKHLSTKEVCCNLATSQAMWSTWIVLCGAHGLC
jgi:hypothetical protein